MNKKLPSVIFHDVATSKDKCNCVCEIVSTAYENGDRLFIAVENEKAEIYLDTLLWSKPDVSFMPHAIAHEKSALPIVISTHIKNLNGATVMLNLCSSISPLANEFEYIHELEDHTSSEKKRLTEERIHAYENKKIVLQQIRYNR